MPSYGTSSGTSSAKSGGMDLNRGSKTSKGLLAAMATAAASTTRLAAHTDSSAEGEKVLLCKTNGFQSPSSVLGTSLRHLVSFGSFTSRK